MNRAMRALVTGGTGQLGSLLSTRLQEAGYVVFAAGRVHGDLARPAAAREVRRAHAEPS